MQNPAKVSALALLPMLTVAGCTTSGEHGALETRTTARLETMLATEPHGAGSGASSAVVRLPPGASRFSGNAEAAEGNVRRREVRLGGSVPGLPGNRAEVVAFPATGGDAEPRVAALKPTDASIHAELAARFPRVAMKVVAEPRHNAYGLLGLAVGATSKGVRCIYAWQWLDDVALADAGQRTPALFRSRTSARVSIRVSVCRAGETADALADYVEQLKIDLSGLDPGLAAPPGSLEATLAPAAPEAIASPHRPRRAAKVAWRHKHGHGVHAAGATDTPFDPSGDAVDQAVAADRAAANPARRSGARTSRATFVPPVPVPALPATLDTTLPSQAYLGPSSAKTARARNPGEEASNPDAGPMPGL